MRQELATIGFNMPAMTPALPEIFVLTMACVILIVDLFLTDRTRVITYLMSLATLVGAALLTYSLHSEQPVLTFSGSFVSDSMADVLKFFVYLSTAVVFVYSRQYLIERRLFKGEFYTLGLFGVLGMMVMVSAHSFLNVYLGLELLSLALYAMVALQRDSGVASEAAMKNFILGAVSSGLLLYGRSILYGVTGSLDLVEISAYLAHGGAENKVVLMFAVAFIIVGVAFKLGAVPFHMWIPDVYHGAATPVTLYISTAPKIAAFAMLMRLLTDGLQGLHGHWEGMLVVLAILSMAVGNIVAIAQGNLKRMLAYSTVSHVGFLLLGILTGGNAGYAASMFYVIVYALMSLGGFGMIILLSRAGFEAENLEDFKGLNERSHWFAAMMAILMFSMAGVGVRSAFIGAFYYLRVVKLMFFFWAVDKSPLVSSNDMMWVLSANGLA